MSGRWAAASLVGLVLVAGCGGESGSRVAASPRVVAVLGEGSEQATGFAVGPGRVVTVAHAVEGPGVRVRLGGGGRRARVVRVDRQADLALLAVPGLRAGRARTSTTGNEGGAHVVVLRPGRAAGVSARVRRSIDARVSAAGSVRPLRRPALELEARTRAGDSGAPVVSEEGEVTGVVFARSRNEASTTYAVDASALEALLAEGGVSFQGTYADPG